MYITFLIGNGFDINLGLKTRYSDFYDFYHEHASKDSIILQWMNEDNDKGNWADLEVTLGRRVKDVDEDNLESFLDAHAELDLLLLEYLESEQKKYSIANKENEIVAEIERSLKGLEKELNTEEQNSYQATCTAHRNEELKYFFITFNYTNILDQMLEKVKVSNADLGSHTASNGQERKHEIGEVHHVHGLLTEGIVLGVNDESQVNNEVLAKNELFRDVFLKDRINKQMGQRRTEHAEQIIDSSQIICIFGMSLGITDKRWWEKIVAWMLVDNNRKLIIYTREDKKLLERKIPTQVIRARERVRKEFWQKGKGNNEEAIFQNVSSRIFVIFNSEIFNLPKAMK